MKIQDNILRIQRIEEEKIITAMEDNFSSYISAIPSKMNNIIFDNNQLLLIGTGIISRLILPDNEERAKYIINSIKEYLSMPLLWCVGPRAEPDNLVALLQACGCTIESTERGMVLNLRELKRLPVPKRLSISLVNSIDLLDDFTQVLAEYWDVPNIKRREEYMQAKDVILDPEFPVKLYIGYDQKKPVTVCELLLSHGIAGIYSVTTVQKMRHRGFASNILSATLLHAGQQGYEIAAVQATQAGERLYKHFGFKDTCMFYKYKSN